MKKVIKKSTENCFFCNREKSLYVAWACFRNVVVLCTCKNEEDQTNLENEGARVLTSLHIDFSDAQGQLTPKSVVKFCPNLNIWLNSVHLFLRYGAKKQ